MLFLSKFKIEGHSMDPEIRKGETVLASFVPYIFKKPKVGDNVVFIVNGSFLIKKIVKTKGDSFFVRGVNKKDSLDSRKFGTISIKQVIGKVVHKL